MGKWLNQLRKNADTPESGADKTDKTPGGEVLSVLSVGQGAVSEKFASEPETDRGGFVSFVSSPSGPFQDFFGTGAPADLDDEERQFEFEERAAILEYDAGMSRAAAEAMARREIDERRTRA